ncbi:hypothetical protein EV714DRAFT_278149, partial [Schizophyllum commune]
MVKAGSTTTGKSATTVKRKAARRTRILSEAPDPEGVEGPGAEAVETAVAVEDADDDDGRAKNEFVDDEAVEDNEEEAAQDDECADFIDDGEPTDVNDGADSIPDHGGLGTDTVAQSDTNATTMSSGLGDAGDTQVLGQTGPEHEEEVDESDGEHSAHSLMIRSGREANQEGTADDDEGPTGPSVIPAASPNALVPSADSDSEIDFEGVRPAAQYFGGFKPNYAGTNYQALLRDAISRAIGISDYAYANGAYKSVHIYDAFPRMSSSAWKPVGALDFPDLQESMENLYPAFGTMKIVCDALNFSACAGYVNLARVNPSRLSFVTGDQKLDGILARVNDPTGPVYCITIGLIRQSFIGPNGFEIEGGYRRGIGLAPFECEAYRAVAALNKIADMKKPNNFTFPLYANGGFVFTTKTLSGDGQRPIVPGWTTARPVKKGRPELVSDRSTSRGKPGVLAYADEIPVVDARRKRIVWGTDTLDQILNKEIWPRFIGDLEYDSVAVVVYTTNRWGRDKVDRIAFNIHSVVL